MQERKIKHCLAFLKFQRIALRRAIWHNSCWTTRSRHRFRLHSATSSAKQSWYARLRQSQHTRRSAGSTRPLDSHRRFCMMITLRDKFTCTFQELHKRNSKKFANYAFFHFSRAFYCCFATCTVGGIFVKTGRIDWKTGNIRKFDFCSWWTVISFVWYARKSYFYRLCPNYQKLVPTVQLQKQRMIK